MVMVLLLSLNSPAFAEFFPEDPSKGERLLSSKGCVKCHALNGEGSQFGPDLVKINLGDTPLDMAARLWNHTPSMILGMEAARMIKPALTNREFADILAYFYLIKFSDTRGNPVRGRTVFAEKGCHLCHPIAGKGRRGEPGLDEFPRNTSPIFLTKGIWNHTLDMVAHMAKIGMKWPTFMETEMMDLLEYIKANAKGAEEPEFFKPGNPKEGKRVFDTKGCNQCHSLRAERAKEGVDLGKMVPIFRATLTQIASTMWNKGSDFSQDGSGTVRYSEVHIKRDGGPSGLSLLPPVH